MNASTIRRKLTIATLASLTVIGAIGLTNAHAATNTPINGPTAPPVESTDRAADKSVAPLNTATVTANTGNITAQINLWRWTGTAWVKEKTGTTNANGGATFRTVRGGAYYMWITTKAAVYFDANGNTHPCAFYTWSTDAGVWVARGATKAIPMYDHSNTCGA